MHQVDAPITSLQALSPGYYLLTVHAPEMARTAQPGQFAQVRVSRRGIIDPLLARPISIHGAHPERGEVSFLFKVMGRGTALLAERTPEAPVTLLGPIGNGFSVPATAGKIALVAGGVGMPPLRFLAEHLRQTRPEVAVDFLYGGRTAADLLQLPELRALGVNLLPATDDGSCGHHGLVTALLQDQPYDFVAACGPRPMLRAVQQVALASGTPGQLSLEARMACGVGACLGCVCGTVSGRRRVCVDGPVFAMEEVTFDA